MSLEFEPASHTYLLEGSIIPGVTEVLEAAGIIDYSPMPDGARTMALERGRFVHLLCQFDDEGVLDEATVDPRLSGYLQAWRYFREAHKFQPELIEHRGYSSTYGYAGTLDRVGAAGQSPALLDIKTSVAPHWTAYQTAAYANFFDKPAARRRMAVELHRDGSYKVHEYRCADFAADLNVFLSALNVYNTRRKN